MLRHGSVNGNLSGLSAAAELEKTRTAQTIFSRQKLMFTLKIICFPGTICIIMCVSSFSWRRATQLTRTAAARPVGESVEIMSSFNLLAMGRWRTLGKTCIFAAVGTCQLIDGGLRNTRVLDQSTPVLICCGQSQTTKRSKDILKNIVLRQIWFKEATSPNPGHIVRNYPLPVAMQL